MDSTIKDRINDEIKFEGTRNDCICKDCIYRNKTGIVGWKKANCEKYNKEYKPKDISLGNLKCKFYKKDS